MSHAVIRHYKANAELADLLLAHQEDIKELIEEIDGFQNYYLIKTADGAISVTICNDAAGCEESSTNAKEWLKEKFPALNAVPEATTGEVIVDF